MKPQPQPIVGTIKHYDWGTTDFIPLLLKTDPTNEPCAELWLGTHPNGPSMLTDTTVLASATGELPYMLKVLSAAEPLSLQTHPTVDQAVAGFDHGVYSDRNAKPELLVALTPFEAFCGIRPAESALRLLRSLGATEMADAVAADGPGAAIEALYRGALDANPAIESCRDSNRPEAVWVHRLQQIHPNDISVAVTLLLNYVELRPGEALRLDAGNLHAYLQGAGVELMGASDNVIRGGLTRKPVNVDELLRIADLTELPIPIMAGAAQSGRYALPAAGVELVRIDAGSSHTAIGHELTIDLDGKSLYLAPGTEYTATSQTFVVTPYPSSGEM